MRPCADRAELRGLPDDKVATIVAGQHPSDLTRQEAIAYDVASALVSGGVLPDPDISPGGRRFRGGGRFCPEFINLVGLYCLVSVILNGFDVAVPRPKGDARGRRKGVCLQSLQGKGDQCIAVRISACVGG